MAVRTSRVVKQLLNVLKLFRVTAGNIHSFRIRSKETLRIMYPKCLVLDMIQRIHLRCRSFGSIIRLWILVKKPNIRLRIKNPDLDFNELRRTLISLFFRTTKFIYSNVSSTQRPRYHGTVNEISEIMGFEIVAQLCLENSIQTLLEGFVWSFLSITG